MKRRSLVPKPRRYSKAADAIVDSITHLYMESRRTTQERARAFGLTGPQLAVLKRLARFGMLSLSSLSEQIQARTSTVSGIIDRLEREKLVRRERSTEDRRRVLLSLTQAGRRLAHEIPLEPMELFREAIESLPARDVNELFRVLARVQKRMHKLVHVATDHGGTDGRRIDGAVFHRSAEGRRP